MAQDQDKADNISREKAGLGRIEPMFDGLGTDERICVHSSDMQLKLDLEKMGINLEIRKIEVGSSM